MNAKAHNGTRATGAGSEQDTGLFNAAKLHGLPLVSIDCPVCGETHDFEDQGLRAASATGCGHVHHLTLDELDPAYLPRRKA